MTDPSEPGSTFKPFIAAGALSTGQTKMDEVFWCHQGYYPHARLRDHHPYGHLTLREVVIKSSNIGMALLGEHLGDEKLHAICLRFGFGRRTGIELPGESEQDAGDHGAGADHHYAVAVGAGVLFVR